MTLSQPKGWQKEAISLKKKYAPRKKFNLASSLKGLRNSISSMDNITQLLRTKSKDQIHLTKILKIANKKLKLLNKISVHFKHEIDMFICNSNKINTNSLSMISTPDPSNSIFSIYQTVTNIFVNSCSLFIGNSKRSRGGRNYTYSKPQFCIHYLIRVFHSMTDEMPECTNDRTLEKGDEGYDAYVGKFYNFLLELRPLLKEAFDIQLGTDKVIGKYANKLIRQYKEELNL